MLGILEQEFVGNTVMQYGLVACVILVGWILAFVASFTVRKILARFINRFSQQVSDQVVLAIRRPVRVLTFMAVSDLGSQLLTSEPVEGDAYAHWPYLVVHSFFAIGMRLSIFWVVARLIALGWHDYLYPIIDKHIEGEEKRFFPVAYKLVATALWIFAVANCIPVLGYDAVELLGTILAAEALHNTIGQYLAFLGLTLLTLLLARTIFNQLYKNALKFVRQREDEGAASFHFEEAWFEGFQRPLLYLITLIGFRLSASVLSENTTPGADSDYLVHGIVTAAVDVCLAVDVTWIFFLVIDKVYDQFIVPLVAGKSAAAGAPAGGFDEQLLPLTRKAAKTVIGAVGGIFMIKALGHDPTTVLAGLGIGGVAIGFAAKDTLSPFISGIAIYLTRPYRMGDYIEVGDGKEGMVEDIGLRATALRTKMGTTMLVPNDKIISQTIHNTMRNGRAYDGLYLRIDIATVPEKRDEAIALMKKAVESTKGAHDPDVHLLEYGDDNLALMLNYWIDDTRAFWPIRHMIMIGIDDGLRAIGVEMSTPTRSISLSGYLPDSEPQSINVLTGGPRRPSPGPMTPSAPSAPPSPSSPSGPLTPPKL